MTPEEIRQLLGGYASGTLSEAEKKLLFEAALEDQVLFDAMADEQALKDLLDDPESRGYLRAVLDEAPREGEAQPDAVMRRRSAAVAAMPAAPAQPAQATAAAPQPREPESRRRGRPAMWWEVLAAAGLAVVSVVGILQFERRPAVTEVASNRPAPETERRALDKSATAAPPASSPVRIEPPRAVGKPRQAVAQLKRDQDAEAVPKKAPAPQPVQASGPPPQNAVAVTPGGIAPPNQPAAQDRIPQQEAAAQASVPGRQQAQPSSAAAPPVPVQSLAKTETGAAPEAQVTPEARKRTGGASLGATVSPLAAGRAGAGALARPVFAMRVRLFARNASGNFEAPVPPDAKFHAGDEIVVVIEKLSAGIVSIERSGTPVPLAIETDRLARSVPLTVTGPAELTVTLARTPELRQPGEQTTGFADGAIYAAAAAKGSTGALVVRIPIRLE